MHVALVEQQQQQPRCAGRRVRSSGANAVNLARQAGGRTVVEEPQVAPGGDPEGQTTDHPSEVCSLARMRMEMETVWPTGENKSECETSVHLHGE